MRPSPVSRSFGQDMLPYTHRLQQSHPHSLTADDGLVPVDAGPDGIPHVSLFFITDWRVESFRLCHSPYLYKSLTGCGNDDTTV